MTGKRQREAVAELQAKANCTTSSAAIAVAQNR
jgi:hypothetical protein